jgi:hypothetical protein
VGVGFGRPETLFFLIFNLNIGCGYSDSSEEAAFKVMREGRLNWQVLHPDSITL